MLWLVPFVSPDSATFRTLAAQGFLVRGSDGRPAIRQWWNGSSAVLDATNPGAAAWLHQALDALVTDHGVDGFKFDGGDFYSYAPTDLTAGPSRPGGAVRGVGEDRAASIRSTSTAPAGRWAVNRWCSDCTTSRRPGGPAGSASLIPEAIAQGLIGHAFVCPDMVGGGDLGVFEKSGSTQSFSSGTRSARHCFR